MKTSMIKERMRGRACQPAIDAFVRSHMSPKKWAQRVFRKAKAQMIEVIENNECTVWYEVSYDDNVKREELGWVAWVLRPLDENRRGPHELKMKMKRVKDPYARLLKFLS